MSRSVEAVLCPHPPLLVRALGGQQDPVVDLRRACGTAVDGLLADRPDRVVVVGPADGPGPWDGMGFDVRRFGTTTARPDAAESLPLSLAIGRMLLDDCGWTGPTDLVGVGWDADEAELRDVADRVGAGGSAGAVLLLGDGSTRRGEKAPGYLDPRAFAYDDVIGDALAAGDAAALRALDPVLGRDLMVGGRSVFRLLGLVAGDKPVKAALDYRDDPFGVSYFVARWSIGA
jgi:hypothetical protein